MRFVVPVDTFSSQSKQRQQGEDEHAPTADRVKALGRWEVDIIARGSHGNTEPTRRTHAAAEAAAAGSNMVPVRKIVEVVAAQE